MITVSVVICTYNRTDLLPNTIQALIAQSKLPEEIIIVDNNSTDNTAEVVNKLISENKKANITYHLEKKQGATHARNAGGLLAKGEILVFFDDDVIPDKEYIKNLQNHFNNNKLDYVAGKIELEYLSPRPEWLDDRLTGILATYNYGDQIVEFPCTGKLFPYTANVAIKKEIFLEVKGFTPNELDYKWSKPCNDDILFGIKVYKAGYSIKFLPGIAVKHLIPEERLTVEYFKSCMYFYGIADIIHQIIPYKILSHLFILLRSLFRLLAGFIKSRLETDPKEKHWQYFRIYYNWGLIVGIIRSRLNV